MCRMGTTHFARKFVIYAWYFRANKIAAPTHNVSFMCPICIRRMCFLSPVHRKINEDHSRISSHSHLAHLILGIRNKLWMNEWMNIWRVNGLKIHSQFLPLRQQWSATFVRLWAQRDVKSPRIINLNDSRYDLIDSCGVHCDCFTVHTVTHTHTLRPYTNLQLNRRWTHVNNNNNWTPSTIHYWIPHSNVRCTYVLQYVLAHFLTHSFLLLWFW